MKILGIIPARGGSKGVPQKNIKNLNGKPLIWYTYQASKASKLLSRTIVSSEDKNILEVCNSLGMDVPFIRPQSLAKDETPSIDVILHALQKIEESKEKYDAICLLQVTNPFRTSKLIDKSAQKFIDENANCLISVKKIPDKFNPLWSLSKNKNNYLSLFIKQESIISRRQDLPITYYRDGSIYLVSSDLIKQRKMYDENISHVLNDDEFYVNIDTNKDWIKAENIINKMNQ